MWSPGSFGSDCLIATAGFRVTGLGSALTVRLTLRAPVHKLKAGLLPSTSRTSLLAVADDGGGWKAVVDKQMGESLMDSTSVATSPPRKSMAEDTTADSRTFTSLLNFCTLTCVLHLIVIMWCVYVCLGYMCIWRTEVDSECFNSLSLY